MPKQSEQQPNYLPLIVIAVIALWWWNGQSASKPTPTPDDQHETENIVEPSQQDYWSALALCVDKSSFGTLQQHTDHLLQVIDVLKQQGKITDDGRIAAWRGKRIEITAENRATISATLRGQ